MRHGSHLRPTNRFESVEEIPDYEHWQTVDDAPVGPPREPIQYLADQSRSIVSENQSPDIPFRYSVNPYRGCLHGCSYWYEPPKPVAPYAVRRFRHDRSPEMLDSIKNITMIFVCFRILKTATEAN